MLHETLSPSRSKVLVTGAAGFIGAALSDALMCRYPGIQLIGIDNMNDYYDVSLKEYRLERLQKTADAHPEVSWHFLRANIAEAQEVDRVFHTWRPDVVVNLAAQAGVRYSIDHPDAYIESNILGFYQILEACRHYPVAHLVYASSSSVYGDDSEVPYRVEAKADRPVSLYAATKKSDELLAFAYAKLYRIPMTGLRFFTVYGPAGRPDMAYFSFTNKLLKGDDIEIFNYGNCWRDFTYIDDIVEGVIHVMSCAPHQETQDPPYSLYNIGNSNPVNLLDFVDTLQRELIAAGVLAEDYDFNAHRRLVQMQPGDVETTFADISSLERDFGFRPTTSLQTGLRRFAEWYRNYYFYDSTED